MLRELLAKSTIMLIAVYQKPLGFKKKPTLLSPKYPHGCFTLALSNSAFKRTFLKMYPEVSGCLPCGYMPPRFLKHTHTDSFCRNLLSGPRNWNLYYTPPPPKKILAVAKHELYCFFLGSGENRKEKNGIGRWGVNQWGMRPDAVLSKIHFLLGWEFCNQDQKAGHRLSFN